MFRAGDAAPVVVSLASKGAKLRLTTDRRDPDLILTLEREGADAIGSVPHDWQRQVWARPARETTTEWSALPAGTYSVYAKYVEPDFFMRRAKKIGKVFVADGETTTAEMLLPGPVQRAAAEYRFYLARVSPSQVDVDDLEAFATHVDGAAERVPALVETVPGGVVVHVAAKQGLRPPVYVTTADRFITDVNDAPDATPRNDPPITARLYSRADGQLVVRSAEKDLPFPTAGQAVFHDCMKTRRVTVPAEIRAGSAVHFTAPASCASGTLSFRPFEPLLLARTLRPGNQVLGEYLLHAAASADVHVSRAPDGAPVTGATVRVLVAPAEAPDTRPMVAVEARSAADGWVQRGLDARRGFAPDGDAAVAVVVVREHHERLLLREPCRLAVRELLERVGQREAEFADAFEGGRVGHGEER